MGSENAGQDAYEERSQSMNNQHGTISKLVENIIIENNQNIYLETRDSAVSTACNWSRRW